MYFSRYYFHVWLVNMIYIWLFSLIDFSPHGSTNGEGPDITSFSANKPAMWVKMVSSWLCAVLYGWTLIAPVVLADRDFGYD